MPVWGRKHPGIVDFDYVDGIVENLRAIDTRSRIFILLILAENTMPAYKRFARQNPQFETTLLRNALEEIWIWLLSGAKDSKPIIDPEAIYDFAPDTGDFSSPYTSRALDACVSIGSLLEYIHGGSDVAPQAIIENFVEALSEVDLAIHDANHREEPLEYLHTLSGLLVLEFLIQSSLFENGRATDFAHRVRAVFRSKIWQEKFLLQVAS